MSRKPYVVSGDIDILLGRWARRKGLTAPQDSFFQELQEALCKRLCLIFDSVEFIYSHVLLDGSNKLALAEGGTVVTLDRVYVESEHRLELTRTVKLDLSDGPLCPRPGNPDLGEQIKGLCRVLPRETKVTLYDDVIFSGHFLEEVCNKLQTAGLVVEKVVCGVGIADGVDRIRKTEIPVACVSLYPQVVDQICERDFYPGVDYSGRTLSTDRAVGFPYVLPFGKPGTWASIPEAHIAAFSRFCIEQSIFLFEEIDRLSGRQASCRDIDRRLPALPADSSPFVEYLKKVYSELDR